MGALKRQRMADKRAGVKHSGRPASPAAEAVRIPHFVRSLSDERADYADNLAYARKRWEALGLPGEFSPPADGVDRMAKEIMLLGGELAPVLIRALDLRDLNFPPFPQPRLRRRVFR